jgi:hypothetical protein
MDNTDVVAFFPGDACTNQIEVTGDGASVTWAGAGLLLTAA